MVSAPPQRILPMRFVHALLFMLLLAVPTVAQDIFQEGTTVTLKLMNGDTITGLLEQADGAKLVILHDIFGRMEIPRAAIAPTPPKEEVVPVSPWSGKFDASLSGSVGNSENQSVRVQLDVKHEDDEAADFFTLWMRRTETRSDFADNPDTPAIPGDPDSDTEVTEEKKFAQWRHEWKLKDSKWRPFVQGSYEADQLQVYDARLAVAAGGAYQFSEGPEHKVSGRVGAGFSHKYGNHDHTTDDGAYEALLGLDWYWTISEMSAFSLVEDFYPSINPSGEFRSITKAAYESKLAKDSAWYWKLGADNFHDSDPGGGKKQNDWNYYFGVGRTF